MNNRQLKQVRMFIRMRLFFAKNKLSFAGFLPLVQLITDWLLGLTELEADITVQGLNETGIAKGKTDKRTLMIDLIVPIARKAKVWAKKVKNAELSTLFNVRQKNFWVSEIEDLALAKSIIAALNLNAADLVAYNITPLQLTDAGLAITDFGLAIAKPEEADTTAKTATENIAIGITKLMEDLGDIDDLIIPEYEVTIPTLMMDYKTNRRIGEPASQHTSMKVHVYGDAAHSTPILGAVVGIVELGRNTFTDVDGMGELTKFVGGNYTLNIVAKGKVNYHAPFTIKAGKKIEQDIIMLPNIIYGNVTNNGKPALNQPVSIENTNLQVMTDNFGKFEMPDVADGHGVIKTSTPGGDSVFVPFVMVNGERLKIDLAVV